MGDKAVLAVNELERRGLPVKLHFWKCLEDHPPPPPPDIQDVTQYMGSTGVTLPMISKRAKQLKVKSVWVQHLCHPENHLVERSPRTLVERARCGQCVRSNPHITFKAYN